MLHVLALVFEMRDCAYTHLRVVCIGYDAYLRGKVDTGKEKLSLTALQSITQFPGSIDPIK